MKKFMILVCFFSLTVFSCKTGMNTNGGSDLTTLSINDSGLKTLNELMKKNKLDNLTFVSLTLTQNESGCSENQRLDKVDPSSSNNNITLKTKAANVNTCTYKLYMEYGVTKNNKDTVYFKGETIVGKTTTINGKAIDNTYKGKNTPVQIPLTFLPTGAELTIQAADLTSETTDLQINPILTNDDSVIAVKDLFVGCPVAWNSINIIKTTNSSSGAIGSQYSHGIILQKPNQNAYCNLNPKVTNFGFTCKTIPVTNIPQYDNASISINPTQKGFYTLLTVEPTPKTDNYKYSANDTLDLNTLKSLSTYGITFEVKATGPQNQSFSRNSNVIRYSCTKQ